MPGEFLTASYQPLLVAVSIMIAVLASYAALGLGGRVLLAERAQAKYWIIGGALAMGIGIWAMHFVGMLAFHLPVSLAYDKTLTALSLLPAVGASAIALAMLRQQHRNSPGFYLAALVIGLGIAAMHYIGMAAMRMFPAIEYDRTLVVLSVLIAVGASAIALELIPRLVGRDDLAGTLWHSAAALVMGIAIAGMHYTGMAAANFPQDSVCLALADGIQGPVLTVLVGFGGILVLLIALTAVVFDKLRDQNAFYATLLRAQSDLGEGVLVLEGEKVVFANHAMTSLAGMSVSQLMALPSVCELFQEPAADEFCRRVSQEALAGDEVRRFEWTLAPRDEQLVHLEVALGSFLHRGRHRTLLVCLDISERKHAHDAMRASEEKLRAMFDFSPLGITLSDLRGRFVEANPALEQMTGYRADELVKLDFYDLVESRHRREVDRLYDRVDADGRFGPVELEFHHRGGAKVPVALNGVLVTDSDGKPYIWSTVEDISERVQATERLRQLNETLEERVAERTREVDNQRQFVEGVLDTAGTLIMLLDRDGRILRFNKACEELSGFSFSELRDKPFWSRLFLSDHVDAARHEFDRLIRSGEGSRYESEWCTRDGERRLISWSNAVLQGASGRPQYVIATGIDVTERKRAERALTQANLSLKESLDSLTEAQDKLVQAEKMASLGGLVAGISHEINTPLGIGVTSASNIREEVRQLQHAFDNNAMKRSSLEAFIHHVDQASEILLKNLRRASELITSFKQVAVDQSSDEWRPVELHDYIDEIILSLRPKWKNSRISLCNDSRPATTVYTHPGAIYQILSNLVLNSLTHAFEPDEPGEIRISASTRPGQLELLYTDDGKGIPDGLKNQIFEPFFTTKRGSGGSGLGLHIVYNLVHGTLGGTMDMESVPGRGVRFRIVVPLISQEQHA